MRIGPMDPDLFRRLDALASTSLVHLARDGPNWCVSIRQRGGEPIEVAYESLTEAVAAALNGAHERGWCDLSQPLPPPARRGPPT